MCVYIKVFYGFVFGASAKGIAVVETSGEKSTDQSLFMTPMMDSGSSIQRFLSIFLVVQQDRSKSVVLTGTFHQIKLV